MSHVLFRPLCLSVISLMAPPLSLTVEAASWKKEPQPLVAGSPKTGPRYAVTATPGSNLAFDSSWRILWSVDNDTLTGHIWNKARYFERMTIYAPAPEMFQVRSGSALMNDPAWHITYFVSPDGRLRAMQKSPAGWVVTETISATVTQVLGVHPDWHTVFAYDADTRSLLAVHWSAIERAWKFEVIAADLGDAPAEGVVDAKRHILYATYQDAPALGISAAAGTLQPWPLVATWWDGVQWKSQAVTTTGVPQRPAHDISKDQLYYTHRADIQGLRSFRPSQGKLTAGERKFIPDLLTKGTHNGSTAPVFGERIRWQGAATWVDDQRYAVDLRVQNYFPGGSYNVTVTNGSLTINSGNSWNLGYVSDWGNGVNLIYVGMPTYQVVPAEPPPHLAVSAHVPLWETPEHAAPGLRGFRSLYSAKRAEIVQQRISEGAWTRTPAHGWQSVPNIYQVPGDSLYYRLGPGVVTTRRTHDAYVAGLSQAGTLQLTIPNNALNVQTSSLTLNNNITGVGGITKTGAGTLTLNGANTYAGTTNVNSGQLILTGSIASTVNVSAGATFSGTGSTGAVVNGGTIAAGYSSIGTLTTRAVTLTGGSSIGFEVSDWSGVPGTGYDTINAASLDIAAASAAPVTINVGGLSLVNFNDTASSFTFLTTTGGISGFAADKFVINSAGFTAGAGAWSVQVSGNDLVLSYTGAAPVIFPDRPDSGQGTSNSGTVVVTPGTQNPDTALPSVITVDGVGYLDPSHAETVTYVPAELRKPLTELLGTGATVADPATLPAEVVDLVETGAGIHTFGHGISSISPRSVAPGGRYQTYTPATISSAKAGGIASDTGSSTVFYVQAPAPGSGGACWIVVVN